uniref:BTB domain-containing protein n=1 Tax=Globodera rostochiensis TaxID=31243 RepID=A0A914I1H1_GLORO
MLPFLATSTLNQNLSLHLNTVAVAAAGTGSSKKIKPVEVPDVEVDAFKAMLACIYAKDLSGLDGDNAISVLYAANKYNLPKLARFFGEEKLLREILDSDKLIINDELTIWNAALRWADEKCRQNRKEPSAANRRAMLGPAPFIKF